VEGEFRILFDQSTIVVRLVGSGPFEYKSSPKPTSLIGPDNSVY